MTAPMNMPINIIQLSPVLEMLATALEEARALEHQPLEDTGTKSPVNRELNSRLLALADGLQLASSLVRAEYWAGRGREL